MFLIGVANLTGKNEAETIKLLCEQKELVKLHDKKREPLRLFCKELNNHFKKKLALTSLDIYGSQFKEIFLDLKCYLNGNEFVGDISLRFSNIYKAAHVVYNFPIDKFLIIERQKKKELIEQAISESLFAIKQKKKGDFNAEKFIADISKCISNFN